MSVQDTEIAEEIVQVKYRSLIRPSYIGELSFQHATFPEILNVAYRSSGGAWALGTGGQHGVGGTIIVRGGRGGASPAAVTGAGTIGARSVKKKRVSR